MQRKVSFASIKQIIFILGEIQLFFPQPSTLRGPWSGWGHTHSWENAVYLEYIPMRHSATQRTISGWGTHTHMIERMQYIWSISQWDIVQLRGLLQKPEITSRQTHVTAVNHIFWAHVCHGLILAEMGLLACSFKVSLYHYPPAQICSIENTTSWLFIRFLAYYSCITQGNMQGHTPHNSVSQDFQGNTLTFSALCQPTLKQKRKLETS